MARQRAGAEAMILTIEEAREALRLDGADNDVIIVPLLEAIPPYIEITTGISAGEASSIPLAKTAAKFILQLWYNAEQAEADKLQRTIDSLLKSLSLIALRARAQAE